MLYILFVHPIKGHTDYIKDAERRGRKRKKTCLTYIIDSNGLSATPGEDITNCRELVQYPYVAEGVGMGIVHREFEKHGTGIVVYPASLLQ